MSAVATESRFMRNIVRIAGGTMFSQAIVIAAMPALARLYRPEDFGALAVFTSVHVLFAALSTLKYELAIILPADNGQALALTYLTLASSALISAVLLLGLCAGGALGLFTDWFYFLVPLSAVLGVATACGQQWNARASDYRHYAVSQVLSSITNISVAFALLTVATHVTGELIIAYLAGLIASTAYLVRGFAHEVTVESAKKSATPRALLATALEYRRFPLLVLPTSLLSMIGTTSLPFILQSMFSLREVGFFAIASRLLMVPGVLVGNAVSEAFRSEFVSRMRNDKIAPLFRGTLFKLAALALPSFALVFVVAPTLFAMVFGADYRESGVLARYLCLGVLAQFLALPFAYVFVATQQMSRWMFVQSISTVAPLVGLIVGGLRSDLHLALLLFSLTSLACGALQVWMAYGCCKQHDAGRRFEEAA